jgi:hypothetical protein
MDDNCTRRGVGILVEQVDSEVVQEAEPSWERIATWGLEIERLARGALARSHACRFANGPQ